jgi:hypothetical protein
LVAAFLIVWWIRSYWIADQYTARINQTGLRCSNLRGSIVLSFFEATERTGLQSDYSWGPAARQRLDKDISKHFYWFVARRSNGVTSIVLPSWFLIILCAGCAIAPWLRWQFNVRTLLIATALVAAALGLIVLTAS